MCLEQKIYEKMNIDDLRKLLKENGIHFSHIGVNKG